MGSFNIDTGYKPEFALGALYAGENAAYNTAMQDEEILQKFLANQREQTMLPLDRDIKTFEAAKANAQNTPELLKAFTESTKAGYNKNIREDEIGNILHPFRKQQAPLQGQRDLDYAQVDAEIAKMQDYLRSGISDNGLPLSPELRDDLNIRLNELTARRGNTPEHWGAIDKENVKGEWDLKKQRLANAGHLAAADKGHRSETVRWATTIAGRINNINTQLSKNEIEQVKSQWIASFLSQGKNSADATKLADSKVSEFVSGLMREKAQLEAQYNALFKTVPGMKDLQTEPPKGNPGTASNPIQLK